MFSKKNFNSLRTPSTGISCQLSGSFIYKKSHRPKIFTSTKSAESFVSSVSRNPMFSLPPGSPTQKVPPPQPSSMHPEPSPQPSTMQPEPSRKFSINPTDNQTPKVSTAHNITKPTLRKVLSFSGVPKHYFNAGYVEQPNVFQSISGSSSLDQLNHALSNLEVVSDRPDSEYQVKLPAISQPGLGDTGELATCWPVCGGIKHKKVSNHDERPSKKPRRSSPQLLNLIFSRKRTSSKTDVTDGNPNSLQGSCSTEGKLFGRPLNAVCQNDELPGEIMDIIDHIKAQGPSTTGIFRRCANAKLVRQLRQTLDNGEEVDLDGTSILVSAAVLKEYLRSLPDALLCTNLHDKWIELINIASHEAKLQHVKNIICQLEDCSVKLLRAFLYMLNEIESCKEDNMMSSINLSICVGPSLLWKEATPHEFDEESSVKIPLVVQFLIENCTKLFPESNQSLEEVVNSSAASYNRDTLTHDWVEKNMQATPPLSKYSQDSLLSIDNCQYYSSDEEHHPFSSCSSMISLDRVRIKEYTKKREPLKRESSEDSYTQENIVGSKMSINSKLQSKVSKRYTKSNFKRNEWKKRASNVKLRSRLSSSDSGLCRSSSEEILSNKSNESSRIYISNGLSRYNNFSKMSLSSLSRDSCFSDSSTHIHSEISGSCDGVDILQPESITSCSDSPEIIDEVDGVLTPVMSRSSFKRNDWCRRGSRKRGTGIPVKLYNITDV